MYIYLSYYNVYLYRMSVLYRNSAYREVVKLTCKNGRVHFLHVTNTGVSYQMFIIGDFIVINYMLCFCFFCCIYNQDHIYIFTIIYNLYYNCNRNYNIVSLGTYSFLFIRPSHHPSALIVSFRDLYNFHLIMMNVGLFIYILYRNRNILVKHVYIYIYILVFKFNKVTYLIRPEPTMFVMCRSYPVLVCNSKYEMEVFRNTIR